jgi:hypothetical protein
VAMHLVILGDNDRKSDRCPEKFVSGRISENEKDSDISRVFQEFKNELEVIFSI